MSSTATSGGSLLKAKQKIQPIGKRKTPETSLGLSENVEALLSYSLTWLTGLLFFVLELKSKFVRFHALQSFMAFVILSVIISIVQASFGNLGFPVYFMVNLNPVLIFYFFVYAPAEIFTQLFGSILILTFIPILLWLFLMYQAGEKSSICHW